MALFPSVPAALQSTSKAASTNRMKLCLLLTATVLPVLSQAPIPRATLDAKHTEAWRQALRAKRPATLGCFTADYPLTEYKAVPCGTSAKAQSVISKQRPLATENQTGDYVITYPSALSWVQGTLLSVENVTSEIGFGNVQGEFNLQINTESNLPASGAGQICSASKNPNCTGWLQFVYDSGGGINIQSWAINYGPCSSNFKLSGPQQSCGNRTAAFQLPAPLLQFSDLNGATLEGDVFSNASTGAPLDQVELHVKGHVYLTSGSDITGARNNWKHVQFDVYGNSGGDETVFNSGSLVSVQVTGSRGNPKNPTCGSIGAGNTTGESTNLTLMPCNLLANGIAFKEGVAPVIASLSTSVAPGRGGGTVVLTAGTERPNNTFVVDGFNPNVAIRFGGVRAAVQGCSNTATASACAVTIPAGSGTVPVTAANVFKDGSLGPASAPVSFSYLPTTPPVTKPLQNCSVCRDSNRQCVAIPGGFKCVGLAQ